MDPHDPPTVDQRLTQLEADNEDLRHQLEEIRTALQGAAGLFALRQWPDLPT